MRAATKLRVPNYSRPAAVAPLSMRFLQPSLLPQKCGNTSLRKLLPPAHLQALSLKLCRQAKDKGALNNLNKKDPLPPSTPISACLSKAVSAEGCSAATDEKMPPASLGAVNTCSGKNQDVVRCASSGGGGLAPDETQAASHRHYTPHQGAQHPQGSEPSPPAAHVPAHTTE